MKHIRKILSAAVMSAVLLCGSVTAAGAAQSRVIVRQITPPCRAESCPDTKSCPDNNGCRKDNGCTENGDRPSSEHGSLCDLLSRCGLSTKQCEELGRLMKQTGNCPGNQCCPAATESFEATEETAEPTDQHAVTPTEEITEAPVTEASDQPTIVLTEQPTVASTEKPTVPPTEAETIRPTEAETVPPAESAEDVHTLNAYEKEVITLVNIIRHENGLGYLRADAELSRVARIKSQDMRENGYFSHTSPTYGSPFDMMKRFGIIYRTAGENIAMGYRSPQDVVDGWMNSPGHRANILNENYTRIGVGYIANGNYWTQLFAG